MENLLWTLLLEVKIPYELCNVTTNNICFRIATDLRREKFVYFGYMVLHNLLFVISSFAISNLIYVFIYILLWFLLIP